MEATLAALTTLQHPEVSIAEPGWMNFIATGGALPWSNHSDFHPNLSCSQYKVKKLGRALTNSLKLQLIVLVYQCVV